MTIWKKAVSTLVTAGLLASLLSAAFAGVASANSDPQALDSATCVPAGCTQVAATGLIQIGADASTFTNGNSTKLTVSGSGATFVAATGNFVLATSTVATDPSGNGAFYLAGEVIVPDNTLLAPATDLVKVTGATAGTGTITEWLWTGASGSPANVWVPDGNTWTLTFTAAADFQVSAATSTVKTYSENTCTTLSSSGNTSTAGTTVGYLGVRTKNAAGDPIVGVSVSGSIQPFGTIAGAQTYSGTTGTGGLLCLPIISAGLSGTSTITATATYLGVSTPLSSTTFTFAGPIATLTASPDLSIGAGGGVSVTTGIITVKAKDANGNAAVLTGVTATLSSGLTAVVPLNTGTGKITVGCVSATAQSKETVVFKSGSIVSNTVTVWCVGTAWTAKTLTVKAATAAIPAGGSTTFTGTLLDANSFPAPDGVIVTGLASAGLVIGDGTGSYNQSATAAGAAEFTYYAQNTTGPVTLTAVAAGVSGAGTITVGPTSPVSTNASKLGLPAAGGSYSTTTKVAALTKYVTWRTNVGAANAGKSVGVYIATKNSAGIWSAFTRVTGRAAASDGTVLYWARRSSASWISVRFSLDGVAFSPARQARWR